MKGPKYMNICRYLDQTKALAMAVTAALPPAQDQAAAPRGAQAPTKLPE